MAKKNRRTHGHPYGLGCGVITPMDKYMANSGNFGTDRKAAGVRYERVAIEEVLKNNLAASPWDSEAGAADKTAYTLVDKKINDINLKLINKEELSKEDLQFLDKFTSFWEELQQKDDLDIKIKQRLNNAGRSERTAVELQEYLNKKIASEVYRKELSDAIVKTFLDYIQYKMIKDPENCTDIESTINHEGLDKIMGEIKKVLTKKAKLNPNCSKEAKAAYDCMLEDGDVWAALINKAKPVLYLATGLKICLVRKVKDSSEGEEYKESIELEENQGVDDEEEGNKTLGESYKAAEEMGREHWQIPVDKVFAFSSMAGDCRRVLYQVPGKRGLIFERTLTDAMRLYRDLMDLRETTHAQNSDEFMSILEKHSNQEFNDVYKILKGDVNMQTRFFNALRMNKAQYAYFKQRTANPEDQSAKETQYFIERSGKGADVEMNTYLTQMNAEDEDALYNQEAELNESPLEDGPKAYSKFINMWETCYTKNNKDGKVTFDHTDLFGEGEEGTVKWLQYINRALSLGLNDSAIFDIVNNKRQLLSLKNYIYQLGKTLKNTSVDKISVLVDFVRNQQINDTLKDIVEITSIANYEKSTHIDGAFRYNKSSYVLDTVPTNLGDMMERLEHKIQEILNSKAKEEYLDQSISDEDQRIEAAKLREFRAYLAEEFLECPVFATKTAEGYHIHNLWLRKIYESTFSDLKSKNSFVHQFANSITRGLGFKEKEFENFNEKDNIVMNLTMYLENLTASKGTVGSSPLFVTGDSNATRYLTTPVLSENECVDAFAEVLWSEFKRQELFNNFVDWAKAKGIKLSAAHAGKLVSEWEADERGPHPLMANAKIFTLFRGEMGEGLYDLLKNDVLNGDFESFKQNAQEHILNTLKDQYLEWREKMQSMNIMEGDMLSKTALTDNRDINSKTNENRGGGPNTDPGFMFKFFLNYKLNMAAQLQMFTIDPGFYSGTEELQKRYKEIIANGTPLDLTAKDKSDPTSLVDDKNGIQDVLYIDEMLVNDAKDPNTKELTPFGKALEEAGIYNKKYESNTLTDGQGWRNFASYRKIMHMLGDWTDDMEKVWQIIQANRNEGLTRLTDPRAREIEELGVTFPPIKAFGFYHENVDVNGTVFKNPVQHKYSEFVIIPELLPKGNKLGELGRYLEAANIDMACCTTVVKVGGFGSRDISKCKTFDDYQKVFKLKLNSTDAADPDAAYVHKLDLRGYRKQSNVPNHDDCARSIGSQASKLMMSGLSGAKGKNYEGLKSALGGKEKVKISSNLEVKTEDMDQEDLLAIGNSLINAGYIKGAQELAKKFGNPDLFSQLLTHQRFLDNRSSTDNIGAYVVEDDGSMAMSPCEGIMAKDNIAALKSIIRKNVINQRMKGGSLVQVSAFGFEDQLRIHTEEVEVEDENGNKVKRTNITRADCARSFAFSVVEDGVKRDLSFYDYVDPDTGWLLKADGTSFKSYEEYDDAMENHPELTKLGKEFPGMIDMLAYRIPTERAYSMLNLRAKVFFPRTMGGIIMVPSQYTTIAGFDFDIDKLYYLAKEFVFHRKGEIDQYSDIEKYNIFGTIYRKDALKQRQKLRAQLKDEQRAKIDKLEKEFEDLGEDDNLHSFVQAVFNDIIPIELDGDRAIRWDDLSEEDRKTLSEKKRNLIHGQKLLEELWAWSKDDFFKDIYQQIDGDEVYTSQEVIEMLFKNITSDQISKEGIQKYKKIENAWKYIEDLEGQESRDDEDMDVFPSTSIKAKLSEIREASGEWKWVTRTNKNGDTYEIKKYDHPLNYYWNQVLEKYPEMKESGEYNKRKLFDETAEELGLYKKPKYEYELEKYDPSKPVLENSQAAICNARLQFMMERLMDYDTFKDRYTPGGPQQLKKAKVAMQCLRLHSKEQLQEGGVKDLASLIRYAADNKETVFLNYDPTDIFTLSHFQVFNAEYDKLIGQAANQNIFSVLSAMTDKFELKEPIQFGSLEDGRDIRSRMVNGQDTELGTAEFLSAAVDAVKDALLEFFGMNTNDFSIACLLAKVGASPMDIGLLLNQPVVQNALQIMNESNGYTGLNEALDMALIDMGIIADKQDKKYLGYKEAAKRKGLLGSDSLVRGIVELDENVQMAAAQLMKSINTQASALARYIRTAKGTSSSSVGSQHGDTEAYARQVRKVNTSIQEGEFPIDITLKEGYSGNYVDPDMDMENFADDVMEKMAKNPMGIESVAFACVNYLMTQTLGNYFPYSKEHFMVIKDAIENMYPNRDLSGTLIDDLNESIMCYLMENMSEVFKDIRPTLGFADVDDGISHRDYYKVYFPIILQSILNQNEADYKAGKVKVRFKDIPLLNYITADKNLAKKADNPFLLKMENIGNLIKTQKDMFISSWADMWYGGPTLRSVAEGLFFYSYYVGAFSFSPISFMHLAPLILKKNLSGGKYRQFFNDVMKYRYVNGEIWSQDNTKNIKVKDVIKSCILNNIKKHKMLAKKVTKRQNAKLYNYIKNSGDSFTVNLADKNIDFSTIITKNSEDSDIIVFAPCVQVGDDLYICDNGSDINFNIIDKGGKSGPAGTITYHKMAPLYGKDFGQPKTTAQAKEKNRLDNASVYTRQLLAKWHDSYFMEQILGDVESAEESGDTVAITTKKITYLREQLQRIEKEVQDNRSQYTVDAYNSIMSKILDIETHLSVMKSPLDNKCLEILQQIKEVSFSNFGMSRRQMHNKLVEQISVLENLNDILIKGKFTDKTDLKTALISSFKSVLRCKDSLEAVINEEFPETRDEKAQFSTILGEVLQKCVELEKIYMEDSETEVQQDKITSIIEDIFKALGSFYTAIDKDLIDVNTTDTVLIEKFQNVAQEAEIFYESIKGMLKDFKNLMLSIENDSANLAENIQSVIADFKEIIKKEAELAEQCGENGCGGI